MIISVEGSIASGKSTTARILARELSYSTLLEEAAANPILADFYAHPKSSALETELIFALLRYHQLKDLREGAGIVTDFSFGKGLAFARMNLSGRDLRLFEDLYDELSGRIVEPDLAIFLDHPVEVLIERIHTRGRPYEQGISASYMERLRRSYLANMAGLARAVEVVRLEPTDSPDIVADKALRILPRPSAPRSISEAPPT